MSSEFREKIWLLLIDKFVLAIVLVLVGFLFSLQLESYKAFEARRVEATKKGFEALERVWGQVLLLESEIQNFTTKVSGDALNSADVLDHARQQREALQKVLHDQEIWLPESSVQKLRKSIEDLGRIDVTDKSGKEVQQKLLDVIAKIKRQLLQAPDQE